jgi:hypothetical protein
MKIHNDVKILQTNLDREYFTDHGKHLNLSEKKKKENFFQVSCCHQEFFDKNNYHLLACNGKKYPEFYIKVQVQMHSAAVHQKQK